MIRQVRQPRFVVRLVREGGLEARDLRLEAWEEKTAKAQRTQRAACLSSGARDAREVYVDDTHLDIDTGLMYICLASGAPDTNNQQYR